jgi:hypothetical protein
MLKFLKSLLFKDDPKDKRKEKYDFVVNLFQNSACWKDYPTFNGGVTGLTPLDVQGYLDSCVSSTTLAEVFSILIELKDRQIITISSRTKDEMPIYRALIWYD